MKVSQNRKRPVDYADFDFDLEKMFADKPTIDCYKSASKWDMPFEREQLIDEIISKRGIQENNYESQYCKGSRDYQWTRMTEAIFSREYPV